MRRDGEHRKLRDTGHKNADARGMCGGRKQERQRERRHHRDVHEHRRKGPCSKATDRVERPGHQGHERNAEQIRKGDARQRDGEREFVRLVAKARREQIDQRGRESPGQP